MRDTNFKVGEVIRIRSWEDMEKEFGLEYGSIPCKHLFTSEMKHICGRTATLERVDSDGHIRLGNWSDTNGKMNWNFSIDMIEKVEDKQLIITYRDGNKVISNLKVNGKVVKTAEAKCCPTDEFDFSVGAKLSVERLLEDKSKVKEVKRTAKIGEYIKIIEREWTFNKIGDILQVDVISRGGVPQIKNINHPRGGSRNTENEYLWNYFNSSYYVVLENYKPKEDSKVKAGDYIQLTRTLYSFDKKGMILKVNKFKNNMAYVLPEGYPEGLKVCNSCEKDGWNYRTEQYKVLKNYIPPKSNKGRDLIGREIKAGTKFKVINVEPHVEINGIQGEGEEDGILLPDAYKNMTGIFKNSFTFDEYKFVGKPIFDKDYLTGIDKENELLLRWDEVEILD